MNGCLTWLTNYQGREDICVKKTLQLKVNIISTEILKDIIERPNRGCFRKFQDPVLCCAVLCCVMLCCVVWFPYARLTGAYPGVTCLFSQ